MKKFNRNFKRTISSLMILMMILTLVPLNVLAEEKAEGVKEVSAEDIVKSIEGAANWLIENDEGDPVWLVIQLARIDKEIPESYLNEFRKEIKDNKGEFKTVTDYAKYSIVASSLGLDATDLFGYNFIEKIYNVEDIFDAGEYSSNYGGIYGLWALDSKNYEVPEDAKSTRDNIIEKLLAVQNNDGGFGWAEGQDSDFDTTAMALQALSNYQDREDVKACVEKALNYLSENQQNDGGYVAWETDSSEAVSQVILALTSLGIDPLIDERFVKDNNLIEKLLSFQLEDGSFEHVKEEGSNGMSTEQALRGLIGYQRFINKDSKFFDMKDSRLVEFPEEPKISFTDIDKASDWAKESIMKAAELDLIKGKGNNIFDPQGKVTRAEFAIMLTKLVELEDFDEKEVFTDVKVNAWYYDAVMKAYKAGIIAGKGNNKFAPNDSITREEMAVMLDRTLKLETEIEEQEIKDIDKASDWAVNSIKLMSQLGIMTGDNGKFKPSEKVTREMAAAIIVRVSELD